MLLINKNFLISFFSFFFLMPAQSHAADFSHKKYTYDLPFTADVENPEVTDEDIEYLWMMYFLPGNLNKKEVKQEFKKDVLALTQAISFFSNRFIAPFRPSKIQVFPYSDLRKTTARVDSRSHVISINANFHPTNRVNNMKYSREAWLLLLCHEVSHIVLLEEGALTISEGRTDYRAGRDCFPSLFSAYENAIFVKENSIPDSIVRLCKRRFDKTDDLNLCFRIISAAKEFSEKEAYYIYNANFEEKFKQYLLPNFNKKTAQWVNVETPDRSIFDYDNELESTHPRPQCRLDTFVRAALKMNPPSCFTGLETNDFELIYGDID